MKRLWVTLFSSLALVGCGEWNMGSTHAVRPWQESRELVALVPNGPTTLFVDASGQHAGLEYDLVKQFAAQNGLKLRFIVTGNQAEAMQRLQKGEAHLAVGVFKNMNSSVVFGPVYQKVEPALIYPKNRKNQDVLDDLSQGKIKLAVLPELTSALGKMVLAQPGIRYEEVNDADGESLFEQVANGELPVALVGSRTTEVMENYFPNVESALLNTEQLSLAWALPKHDAFLANRVKTFFSQTTEQGILANLIDRYYGHVNRLDAPDSIAFLSKRDAVLPSFRDWFHEAEEKTGLDWRLIAALSYQESHWNPDAVSYSGVRGVMMLTQDTAEYLGVDRLDPYQSIMGGAQYMKSLIDAIPERIQEPDRTWMGLAAYNVGMGHLEDARILAKRLGKNPDSWADVKTTLPLLRNPEYFKTVKYGYARGGEPVIFVESLRGYFDILARFEAPYQQRNTMLAENVIVNKTASANLRVREPV